MARLKFMTIAAIPQSAWGEASRNLSRLTDIISGHAAFAGLYRQAGNASTPLPDQLVAVISCAGNGDIEVREPGQKRPCGHLTPTWIEKKQAWLAYRGRGSEVSYPGVDHDPAAACGLITGITA